MHQICGKWQLLVRFRSSRPASGTLPRYRETDQMLSSCSGGGSCDSLTAPTTQARGAYIRKPASFQKYACSCSRLGSVKPISLIYLPRPMVEWCGRAPCNRLGLYWHASIYMHASLHTTFLPRCKPNDNTAYQIWQRSIVHRLMH